MHATMLCAPSLLWLILFFSGYGTDATGAAALSQRIRLSESANYRNALGVWVPLLTTLLYGGSVLRGIEIVQGQKEPWTSLQVARMEATARKVTLTEAIQTALYALVLVAIHSEGT